MVAKLLADGAEKIDTSDAPNSLPESIEVITCPTSAGSDKKAVAKITGITPAAISLIGRIDLIPPYEELPCTRLA